MIHNGADYLRAYAAEASAFAAWAAAQAAGCSASDDARLRKVWERAEAALYREIRRECEREAAEDAAAARV